MENHHRFGETKVLLSMNISCCDRCPKILKKKLLKMPGVDSISIDMENDVVKVMGSLDPMTLLNNVAKLGKRVQLLPDEDARRHHPNNNKKKPKVDENNSSCEHMKNLKEEEAHKCEPYEGANISEKVCRDFYCKVHPRGGKIVDKVSSREGSSFLHYWNGPHASYTNPMWYGVEPPPPYEYHRQRMLPRPFGFE